MGDAFGDRMKSYEKDFTKLTVKSDKILCVRLDGKKFSKFTKGFEKPFDDRLSQAMIDTTNELVKATNADIGYTSSDEITLVFMIKGNQTEHIYGGKVSKINSILASIATAYFNKFISENAPEICADKGFAFFDCRAWGVPIVVEAMNVLLWRMQDAKRNSISTIFRWTIGHSEMHGLNGFQMIDYMRENGVSWSAGYNSSDRFGTIISSKLADTKLSDEVLSTIDLQNRPVDGIVKRKMYTEQSAEHFMDMDISGRIKFMKGE